MTLNLHYHPLSSYCMKALVALYEMGTPFEARHLDLMDADERARFTALWPLGKMPVIEDTARHAVMGETSLLIEYLGLHYPGKVRLLPEDPKAALEVRLWDRVCDLSLQTPMQKYIGDTFRPEGKHDPFGVEQAAETLRTTYRMMDDRMAGREWLAGDTFSLADCAAMPGLFYGGIVVPFAGGHPNLNAYFERLVARPTVARVLAEAKPWFHLFPMNDRMPARFR